VLLQTLFDWHPKTISTPGIYASRFYYFYERHSTLPKAQLIERFIENFQLLLDPRKPCLAYSPTPIAGEYSGFTRLGADKNQMYLIDEQLFRTCLTAILADYQVVPRKLLFQAVHVAYRYALGHGSEIDSDTRIVFPLHCPIPNKFTQQFAEDFPQAQYVLMVRNPIDTTASMVKHLNNTNESCFFLYGFLYQALFGGVPSATGISSRCRAVKLEDLHCSPRETLERLCQWLSLPWDETLMKSTVHGMEWWGGNDSLGVNGFSQAVIAKRHQDQLTKIDVLRLNVLLAPKSRKWSYELAPMDTTLMRKLTVLPLLMVPFVMELEFLKGERKDRISFSSRTVLAESLPRPIAFLLWFSWVGTLLRYVDIRRHLLSAWLYTFAKPTREAELL